MIRPIFRRLIASSRLSCQLLVALFVLHCVSAVCWSQATEESKDDFLKYGIYAKTAPRAATGEPVVTELPIDFQEGDKIALIGNGLLEQTQYFGYVEARLHQAYPTLNLRIRNLAWSADTPAIQPRPANFADQIQHLTHEKVDVILASYGFNESFQGADGLAEFSESLRDNISRLKQYKFNGETCPQIVLLSPIANENVSTVSAGDRNNESICLYTEAMQSVAEELEVGFVDLYSRSLEAIKSSASPLTFNGIHLDDSGQRWLAEQLLQALAAPDVAASVKDAAILEPLRTVVLDKNRQYFRRYRPLNTFYYTGDRNKTYGYLDFLPAMRNFDMMVENRDQRIWEIAQGQTQNTEVSDANIPLLPLVAETRGANQWMSAADELASFDIDPRFDVTLFAGEEEFPDLAAPIQMRWDNQGRLWVSCSTTYPHVYPGNEPDDKLIILEDTDGDGKADRSSVFAENLHIPLSFEFGDGGVYVSEMPHLTFLKDTDGDGRADLRRRLLTGFGTEDSHHSLHDFAWTPDGDLLFRESVFHHSQVETPYGPIRQRDSGWFRYQPRTDRLISFGTYFSTNPWGVTFDDWGQHVASHPIYAAAFHSLDPPYPQQHAKPVGLRAYSGTCGQEFVDISTFPSDLQGGYIKARYKPTNRIEIHRWQQSEFGYDEQYVGDIIFSKNLSFIPVDIRFGPRGALYVCDWYNPIKGHMQYALRDERRDRHSGRIWRITAKGHPLQDPIKIADATIPELLEHLKRPESRFRYWTRRELRERDAAEVEQHLDEWVQALDPSDARLAHHQLEAIWIYRSMDEIRPELLRELFDSSEPQARAAATKQLRWWHMYLPDAIERLRASANDSNAIVRMEAAIAASYIGTPDALEAMLDTFLYPMDDHVAYAITCALNSHTLQPIWKDDSRYGVGRKLRDLSRQQRLREPSPNARQAQFDGQPDLAKVEISCIPERMLFSKKDFHVRPGQPVKLVFSNPDATDHNLVIVRPGALEEVGMAANEMAKDPKFANSDFIPKSKASLIIQSTPMIGPTRKSQLHVLRFKAPKKPGVYPFVCTFPGHWVVMQGDMVVADNEEVAAKMLEEHRATSVVRVWSMDDFEQVETSSDEASVMRGMKAFVKARCMQCHAMHGHGVALGPDLAKVKERFLGKKLLAQIIEPSSDIHPDYQTYQIIMDDESVVTGLIVDETETLLQVVTNPLTPEVRTEVEKEFILERIPSKISSMPEGMVNMLTKQEILDLVGFLEAGGFELPEHLEHHH